MTVVHMSSPPTRPPVRLCERCGKVPPGSREEYVPARGRAIVKLGYCLCHEPPTALAYLAPETREMYRELAPPELPEPKAIEAPEKTAPESGEETPPPPASSMPYARPMTPEVVSQGVRDRMRGYTPPPAPSAPQGPSTSSIPAIPRGTYRSLTVTGSLPPQHPLNDLKAMWAEIDADAAGETDARRPPVVPLAPDTGRLGDETQQIPRADYPDPPDKKGKPSRGRRRRKKG